MTQQTRLFITAMLSLALASCGGISKPVASSAGDSGSATVPNMPGMSNPTGMPKTIPALRQWQSAVGVYQFTASSRIIVASANLTELLPVAQVFAEDLLALTGNSVGIFSSAVSSPLSGDMSLSLSETDTRVGTEGYRMTVGPLLEIKATKSAGAFYGTRSALQLLHQNRKIQAGEALDWPSYAERGLMVDEGGKLYTLQWIEAHLRDLAYLKLNYFHFHFSDAGFSVESTSHPEIVSTDHLSKAEVSELVALAARYFVTVVPEIDMPGHMTGALAAHPEFQIKNIGGQAAADKLDITNAAALQFTRELIEEYLPLFPGPYFHIGGDEYMPDAQTVSYPQLMTYAQAQYGVTANAKDAIRGFFNWADILVRSHGKVTRAWHDEMNGGNAVTVNPDIIVEWWTNSDPLSDVNPPTAQSLLNLGHTIMNASNWPTYYNVGGLGGAPQGVPPVVDMCTAYQNWQINLFAGTMFGPAMACNQFMIPPEVIADHDQHVLGSKLHVWHFDAKAETQSQTADNIFPRLRVISQKTWESPMLTPVYSEFQVIMDAIGHSPGFALDQKR